MENPNQKSIEVDILKHVEVLTGKVNEMMAIRTKSVFARYPITFTLVVLVGIVAVSEGIKGVLQSFGWFADRPWHLLIVGLIILIITGTVYKKLDKAE